MIRKQTNIMIKCMRTDNGGEFTNNDFKDFLVESGTEHQRTAAYTPHQMESKRWTIVQLLKWQQVY